MKAARQNEISQVPIGDHVFHVRKFRALPSARISGNLIAVVGPLLGDAGPLLETLTSSDDDGPGLFDIDFREALPAIAGFAARIDGKKLEALFEELLVDGGYISVDGDILTASALDDIFCGDLAGLYRLAFEVIKINFGSLFTLLGFQSGSREEAAKSLI